MCADTVLNQTPDFTSSHTFSTNDITGTYGGLTQGDVLAGETPVIDFTATPKVVDGVSLYPINSEFGYKVTDFVGAVDKDFTLDPDYAEGWAGDLQGEGGEHLGLVVSNAPTDTFKVPALLGTWLSGLGGNSVKASTEHYSVMQNVLSDQRYPGDPDALYPLDDNLMIVGGTYDGQYVADVLPIVGDVNGDGEVDVKDVLLPNETEISENILVSTDYSVTMKDDGKLLYRWGNMIKKPNDIRLEATLDLPDEWAAEDDSTGLLPLYRVTAAELIVNHTITNNPNDQIRPEDFENEAAIGQLPTYTILDDGKWVTTDDYYAGDGTLYPAGTVLKDPALAAKVDGTLLDQIGATSADLEEGYTNAWYTTMDREPFVADLNDDGTGYDIGPRWRLQTDKYGQDLPSVVIPEDPSLPPPPTKDEVKYEVGEDTTTVLNLLDWETSFSPLTLSAGFQGGSGATSVNGLNMTDGFDVAFYVKGDVKPATLYDVSVALSYEDIAVEDADVAIAGTDGSDYLVGQGGNTFTGGAGEDLFVLSYGNGTAWPDLTVSTISDFVAGEDQIGLIDFSLTALNFRDMVEQSVEADGLHLSVLGTEFATLTGVSAELDGDNDFLFINRSYQEIVTGTGDVDQLIGDAYDNRLEGLAGNDTLYGLEGNDTLDGGDGDDTMTGGDGDDLFIVDSLGDMVVETAAWLGTDTIEASISYRLGDHHVENLQLSGAAIVGAGNALDNRIIGTSGDNILDGGQGADTMEGGAGHDTYIARTAGDNAVDIGGGLDTVKAYLSYKLDLNVERLALQAVTDGEGNPVLINGIGNYQDNTIIGNNDANILQGRGGLDTLKGQLGADTFAFVDRAGAGTVDRIIDFNTNVADEGDMLLFRAALYDGLTAGTLAADAFVLGTAAADADDRFIFDQASGSLWFDTDGTGATAQELVATFENGATLAADDFIIV